MMASLKGKFVVLYGIFQKMIGWTVMYSLVTLSADIQWLLQVNLYCVRISHRVKKCLVLPYYGGGHAEGQYDGLDGVLPVLALLFEDGD